MTFEKTTTWDQELEPVINKIWHFFSLNKLAARNLSDENATDLLNDNILRQTDTPMIVVQENGGDLEEKQISLLANYLNENQSSNIKFHLLTNNEGMSLLIIRPLIN